MANSRIDRYFGKQVIEAYNSLKILDKIRQIKFNPYLKNMFFSPADFGFDLSNREIATFIYLGLMLAGVLLWKTGRPLANNVLRAFFAPKLALIWLLMSLYVLTCTWLLAWLGWWEWTNFKSTLLWWLTVGFSGIVEAQHLKDRPDVFRKLIRDTFKISAVILFVTTLVSFPLWGELLMLPILVFLNLLIVLSERQTAKPGVFLLLKTLQWTQAIAGTILITFSYHSVISDIDKHWSTNTLREFGLPFLLWLLFIPLIFLLLIYMTYEETLVRLQLRPRQAPVAGYTILCALFSFGWNIEGLKRLSRHMRDHDLTDKVSVREAIREIKQLFRVEKNPPTVTRTEGWSPYAARFFLEKYGFIAEDYHRTQSGWLAQITSVKLADNVGGGRISYYIDGNDRAATQLRIAFNGSNQKTHEEARGAFDECALTLLGKIFKTEQVMTIYAQVIASENKHVVADDIRVFLDEPGWRDPYDGNYANGLTIRHFKHQ